jgi:hypothetical protein
MTKFKEGDKVKVIGRNATLNRKIKYGDVRTVTNTMSDLVQLDGIDGGWLEDISVELTEDTSKPVTVTHEGNVYEVGKRYVFTDSLPLGNDFTVSRLNFIYVPNSDPSYVFDSEGLPYRYAVSLSEVDLDTGTITPAPIDLIDGNAYMFDYHKNRKPVIGVYSKSNETFLTVSDDHFAFNCTNIRPMTVTESK